MYAKLGIWCRMIEWDWYVFNCSAWWMQKFFETKFIDTIQLVCLWTSLATCFAFESEFGRFGATSFSWMCMMVFNNNNLFLFVPNCVCIFMFPGAAFRFRRWMNLDVCGKNWRVFGKEWGIRTHRIHPTGCERLRWAWMIIYSLHCRLLDGTAEKKTQSTVHVHEQLNNLLCFFSCVEKDPRVLQWQPSVFVFFLNFLDTPNGGGRPLHERRASASDARPRAASGCN